MPIPVPELTDGDVRLRGHRAEDVARVVEQVNDERSRRWTTVPMPYGPAEAEAFLAQTAAEWADGSGRWWAVEVDGRFAGTVNYTVRGGGAAEIGFGLHPDARGRRVATRAVGLVLAYAFAQDGVGTMGWRAARGNLASWRVAWGNGFSLDGTWPGQHVTPSGVRDDLWVGHLDAASPREPRLPWWEPKTLQSNGIRLREWREPDRPGEGPDEVARAYVVSETMVPSPETFDSWLLDTRTAMATGEGVHWCIADARTDEVLGGIQVDQLDSRATRGSGMVAYWLAPPARGRGVLGTALGLVVDHAFAERTDLAGRTGLGLHRLWAGTDARNRASQRALRRAGFREVLHEKQVLTHAGQDPKDAFDAISFELLATDGRAATRVEPAPATVIETARLRLRPWRESDRPAPGSGPDEAALRGMPAGVVPTAETFDEFLRRRGHYRDKGTHDFAIADRVTDEVLGSIAVFGIDREVGHGEVGYWLHPGSRGKGYLDESLAAVVQHAFRPADEGGAGLDRLHAGTVLDNYSSRAALLRNGFRLWGEDHQAYVAADGERSDGAYYELLRDWVGRSSAVATPVIEGERVRLRPWRPADAAAVVVACTDPTTRHWLAGLPEPYDEAAARAYVHQTREEAAAGRAVTWCIADVATDEPLGALELGSLRGPRPGTASVGYWALPEARGRGAVTEGVRLAVRHAFVPAEDGGLDRRRLVLIAGDSNTASQAVAERIGFSRNGIEHQAERLGDGSTVDMVRFELLADDWTP